MFKKTITLKTFTDILNNELFKSINKNTIIISDIDGVLFSSFVSPGMITGNIDKDRLDAVRKLSDKSGTFWFFTDRPYWSTFQNYEDQLIEVFGKDTRQFKTSSEFVKDNSWYDRAIIFGGHKKSSESKKVIQEAIDTGRPIVYIAAQDLPFSYKDKDMLEQMDTKGVNLSNVTFIDIR
jgi:hypothetical protein